MNLGDGPETWYPDSDASAHTTLFDDNLVFPTPYNGCTQILVVNGTMLPIK